jgi:hypothetical protein
VDGPGAGSLKGTVFINSGYPRNGGLPGKVLLAFEAQWNYPSGTFSDARQRSEE